MFTFVKLSFLGAVLLLFSKMILFGKEHSAQHQTTISQSVCSQNPLEGKLTLIVTDLGMHMENTDRAIRELPPFVVLSFSPYAVTLNKWIQPARLSGHEILLELYSEKDLDSLGIVMYFDGVLLRPEKPPTFEQQSLRQFIDTLIDAGKMIVEGRFFKQNKLIEILDQEKKPYFQVSHSLTPENIFQDNQDVLSQKGIVMIPGILVPYLIQYLNAKKPEEIQLLPLQTQTSSS